MNINNGISKTFNIDCKWRGGGDSFLSQENPGLNIVLNRNK